MARGAQRGAPSRNPGWLRVSLLQHYLRLWDENGSLYGGGYDVVEERAIRAELEELGIPMGYGRVGRRPTQLTPMFANRWR